MEKLKTLSIQLALSHAQSACDEALWSSFFPVKGKVYGYF